MMSEEATQQRLREKVAILPFSCTLYTHWFLRIKREFASLKATTPRLRNRQMCVLSDTTRYCQALIDVSHFAIDKDSHSLAKQFSRMSKSLLPQTHRGNRWRSTHRSMIHPSAAVASYRECPEIAKRNVRRASLGRKIWQQNTSETPERETGCTLYGVWSSTVSCGRERVYIADQAGSHR